MAKIFIPFFLLLLSIQLPANTLRGIVTDESKKPIEFSNILLHKYEDPSYLNGTTTDSLGKFDIQKIDDGRYFLEIVYIGYKADTIQNIELKNEEVKDLGELQLTIEANTLKGVEISGNKPVIERRADRIIFNAENSTAGTGENLLDMLRRVPSVTVSGTDEIRVNGKSQVQVMINGKIETLTGDQLATMLKSIQSDNVKKIEIISNPSARFDASAKGGILDIQLKTNNKSGVNGNIHSGYRQGKFGRTDNGFNLNVNYNKIIVSTTYNFGVENNYNTKEFIRNFHLENAIQQFREHTYDRGKFMFHYANLSMKYNINDKHSIGIGGEFFTFRNPTTPLSIISIVSDTRIGKIDSSQFTNIHNLTKNINPSLNFNYRGNLDSAGSTLDLTYDYTYFNLNTSSHLNTTFLDDSYTEYRTPVDFTQNNPFIVNLHTAKLDYYKPLKNKHTIDFGAKFSWTRTHNDIHFSNFIGDQYINDVTKSNEFIYIENTNALYSTWSKMWKKNWSTNVGMRIEQTNTDQHSVTLNTTIRKHYIDFFPSAFIQKTIKEKHVLNLNYSRKIHRPDFKDLNPFQFYNSSYSIFTGNPNLKPEYINVVEFTYSYDNTYTIVLGWENRINNYTYLAKQNDTTKIHTYQATNFKVRNNFNISFNINKELFKWWSINIESRFMYFKYNSMVNDAEFKLHSLKFGMSMDNTFILPKDFRINLFAFYESPFLDATDWVLSNGMVNFAITKTFFQKQLKVKVGVNDIFSTLNNSYNTRFQNIDTRYKQKFTSRVINISVSYNFSKGKQFKNTQTNKSNSDEKGRIH